MSYAEKVQRLCALRGIDQATLASELGLSRSSTSRILSGSQEPKLGLAFKIAKLLQVPLEYLADDEVSPDATRKSLLLDEDEVTILKLVRRLGVEGSLNRLLAVEPPAASEAGSPAASRQLA